MKKIIVLIGLMLFSAFRPTPAKAQLTQGVVCIGGTLTGIGLIVWIDGKCRMKYYAVWDKDAPADCWCVKTTPRQMRIENWGMASGPHKKAQACYDFLNTTTNCPPSDAVHTSGEDEDRDAPPILMHVEKSPTLFGPWVEVASTMASPDDDGKWLFVETDVSQAQMFYRVLIPGVEAAQ